MGSTGSPYSSVQFCSFAEEFASGCRFDLSNQLRWDTIKLNFPGSKSYNPTKPRVFKWDKFNQQIAGAIIIFVDDLRGSGATVEHAWAIARQVVSRFQYYGMQDATRKRKPPSQTPGAWAGAVMASKGNKITKTVTLEKWTKGKLVVDKLWDQLQDSVDGEVILNYKELERARGFLGHLSMTYEMIVPYLKGFHHVLAAHLPQRDQEGWKLSDAAWKLYCSQDNDETDFTGQQDVDQSSPPITVLPNAQFKNDVYALHTFFDQQSPPIISDRSLNVQVVRYGFGDASGTGFGSTIQTNEGIKYCIGVWGSDDEDESPYYKELENIVATIESEAAEGQITDSELFFFTDNSTVEAAIHNGNSSSKKLFELVVRFRAVQFRHGTHIIVPHVAGKRMIEQGTDGVSRGTLKEGVATGMDMLQFIPLHQGALERHTPLLAWLKSWIGNQLEVLTPAGWFTRGQDWDGGMHDRRGFWRHHIRDGTYLWAPPPGAAQVALEQRTIIRPTYHTMNTVATK